MPDNLTTNNQAKFTRLYVQEKEYFIYKSDNNQHYTPPLPLTFPEKYHIATPRVLQNKTIHQLSLDEFIHILSTKK